VLATTRLASITLFVSRTSSHYCATANLSTATYGYAKQYSGVNLASFIKHITSAHLTKEGLQNVGPAVMELARVEELEAHRRAVSLRLGVA
jgi:phosphoribosyl-ATP pyrophosphohydrolase/phosphoribosyl-AMP cyclohydrolase/histidinol dehydrogenase